MRGGKRKTTKKVDQPEMITTTIALDAETHRRLRRLAIDEGTTFRDLVRDAISDYMAKKGGRSKS